jgi:hypothetical protein
VVVVDWCLVAPCPSSSSATAIKKVLQAAMGWVGVDFSPGLLLPRTGVPFAATCKQRQQWRRPASVPCVRVAIAMEASTDWIGIGGGIIGEIDVREEEEEFNRAANSS